MVKYTPKRGDIVWLNFDPQTGKEIQKIRPALVISPYAYNLKSGLGLFMPITSKIKGLPFEVLVDIEGTKSAVLCDQIRSLDWHSRDAQFICSLSAAKVADAIAKIQVLLS